MKDCMWKLLKDQAGSSPLHCYSHSIGHNSVTWPQPNHKGAGKYHLIVWPGKEEMDHS